jgi:hypothetical protein
MPESGAGFLSLASSRGVVISSLKVALAVGSILALINHGGAILQLALSSENVLQILLTYLVPYSVSTYSSVKALQRHTQEHSD